MTPLLVRLSAWAWDNRTFVSILSLFVVAYFVVIGYQGFDGCGCLSGLHAQTSLSSSFTVCTFVRTKWIVNTATTVRTSQSTRGFLPPTSA